LFLCEVTALAQLPDVLRNVACDRIIRHSHPIIIPLIDCQSRRYISEVRV
jgi:hypothetical protein